MAVVRIASRLACPRAGAGYAPAGGRDQSFVEAVRTEATLSFLGLGVPPPAPSWGNMLDDGRVFLQTAPWMILFPAGALALTILGMSLLGDGLRDALDPKLRSH